MISILLVNGPNLNMLGKREPEVYGSQTLDDIVGHLEKIMLDEFGGSLAHVQSNHEGDIIDAIHQAMGVHDGIIINPGAFTHYSYAIRDALSSVVLPTIEIHMSNVHAREEFRHHSVIAPVVIGQIVGLGADGYEWALRALVRKIQNKKS